MSGSISIQASMSIQNLGNAKNGSLKSLLAQYDQMMIKKNRIENNKSIPQQNKDAMLAQLDKEMNDMDSLIEEAQKKEDEKKQQKQYEDKREQLERTMDPDTAEKMLQMEKMMTATANQVAADASDTENTDDNESENDLSEKAAIDKEQTSSETIATKSASTETDADTVGMEKTEEYADNIPEKQNIAELLLDEDNMLSDHNGKLYKHKNLRKYEKGYFVDKKI